MSQPAKPLEAIVANGMLQTTQQALAAFPGQCQRPILEQGTQLFATKTCTAAIIQHAPQAQKLADIQAIIGQLIVLQSQITQSAMKDIAA